MTLFRRQHVLCVAGLALLLAGPTGAEELNQPLQSDLDWLGIRSISLTVDLDGDEAVADFAYELVNVSEEPASANVGISGRVPEESTAGSLSLEPGQEVAVTDTRRYPIRGQGLRGVRIDTGLRVDGARTTARPEEIKVQVKLPQGITRLVSSSLPFELRTTRDGRSVASFEASNLYLKPLVLKWHRAFNLSVSKIGSVEGRDAQVAVKITNAGPDGLGAFTVRDDFPPGFVESGAPEGEFEIVRGQENDVRLVWSRHLPGLAAGETAAFNYSLRLRIEPPEGLTFGGTTVTEDATGDLVGASEAFQVAR